MLRPDSLPFGCTSNFQGCRLKQSATSTYCSCRYPCPPQQKQAFLVSLAVYLLPLTGPHALLPWGVVIVAELTEGLNRPDSPWVATDAALAVTLQTLAAFLADWHFARAGWKRLLDVVPAVPILWAVLMWSYVHTISRYFVVDPQRSPEIQTWEEHRRVNDAYLPSIKTPVDLSLESAGRACIARLPNSGLGILQMLGCEVNELGIPRQESNGGRATKTDC